MNTYKKMMTKQIGNKYDLTICRDNNLYRPLQLEKTCTVKACTNQRITFRGQLQGKHDWKISLQNKYRLKTNFLTNFGKMTDSSKPSPIVSQDVQKFFKRPIMPFLTPKQQKIELPLHFSCNRFDYRMKSSEEMNYSQTLQTNLYKNVGTQTDYRESETQTIPWEPVFHVRPGHCPEVLTLAHLSWGCGLPAGVHEIEIINRMRIKRIWETILPPANTPKNIKMRTKILAGLEAEEWAYRESEIQFLMDLRLELMEKLSRARRDDQEKKNQGRIARLQDHLMKFKEEKVNSIRFNLRRDLRKLRRKHDNWQRLKKREIITDRPDLKSYALEMKYGRPARDEILNKKKLFQKILMDKFIGDEGENTDPNWLPTYEELKAIKPKPKPSDLCVRRTKLTEEKLAELHDDLKGIRLKTKSVHTSTLLHRKYKDPTPPVTPMRSDKRDIESAVNRASQFIQKIVKGRAIQCMMVEGRERCRELIEELSSTHALEEHDMNERQREKDQLMELQREQNDRVMQEDRVCEILNSLEGNTISGALDFLSKELIRLQDERRAHAFALLAERERSKREAEEAGRRQQEQNRRRELDEMFRQVVKVNQDSIEVYLEDIIKENIEWVSEKAADEYISEFCRKANEAAACAAENTAGLEQEEIVTDMIYNFVLPEVEKQSMRKKLKEKQEIYLRYAHQAIYETIINLPPVKTSESDTSIEEKLSTGVNGINCTNEATEKTESEDDDTQVDENVN